MKTAALLLFLGCASLHGASPQDQAATAINQFGLDLYRAESATLSGNILFSPYSLENALAMAYAGADGETHKEMQRVLHYASDDEDVNRGFGALKDSLAAIALHSKKAHTSKENSPNDSSTPIEIESANKLFLQSGWPIKAPFISVLKNYYGAAPEPHDFHENPEAGREAINQWVKKQTHDRIQSIIPEGALKQDTRLVLANALYFRAGWQKHFISERTEPREFSVNGTDKQFVPTMSESLHVGYHKSRGLTVVTVPYENRAFQFVIIIPDDPTSFAKTEKSISAFDLAEWSRLKPQSVVLYLPRFKLELDVMALKDVLIQLGLKTAFDQPKGSANFARIAPPKPNDYLGLSSVFHKTWLALDEEGTEAAGVTAVELVALSASVQKVSPPEVHVDRPFLFAIQHVESGACLFFGRVMDPR